MTLKAKDFVTVVDEPSEEKFPNLKKMKKSIPSSGVALDKK